jgi:hypothetical protein
MISSPITNPNRVPDGSKNYPRISPAIGWYMLLEKNKSANFSDGHVSSTISFIDLSLRPSTIICKRKLLLIKYFRSSF